MKFKRVSINILVLLLIIFQSGSTFKNDPTVTIVLFEHYIQHLPGTSTNISMIAIEGGTYQQGSPLREKGRKVDEGPQHEVVIGDFWMGEFEITWEQYNLFAQRQIDEFKYAEGKANEVSLKLDGVSSATTPYVDMSFGMGKDGFPAINITQYAASVFCKWLSATTGNFYRLPTEAEWEYACRAGSSTAYHFGDNVSQLGDYAWYYDNSDESYHKVGLKKPNAWGLYDMHGNVSEWTLDQYGEAYYAMKKEKPSKNEWNFPTLLYPRTARGGSWYDDPENLRSASRLPSNAKWKQRDPQIPKSLWWHTNAPFIGFRIVRPKQVPQKEAISKYWLLPIEDL